MTSVTFKFDDLPKEFTDYMFDQLTENTESLDTGSFCRQIAGRTELGDGEVLMSDTALGVVLQRLYEQKHANIEKERVDEERDDYGYVELMGFREALLQATNIEDPLVVEAENDVLNPSLKDDMCDMVGEYLVDGVANGFIAVDYENQSAAASKLLVEHALEATDSEN